MALITIDKEKLDSSIGLIVNTMNGETRETMQSLAQVLMPMEGQNNLVDATIADCRKFQNQFNIWTDKMRKVIDEIGKVIQIDEYRNKLDVASVKSHDTDFTTGNINIDAVLQ